MIRPEYIRAKKELRPGDKVGLLFKEGYYEVRVDGQIFKIAKNQIMLTNGQSYDYRKVFSMSLVNRELD